MRKLLVLAAVATLLMAGSAFAVERHFGATPNATFAFGTPGTAFGPTTTNNDDSCDIGTAPAATLLLPYFEVDITSPAGTGQTTLFTITNVTQYPQIAHVTLWTDYSFPVLDFNLYLTGYDVQGINLYDVIKRGIVAPPSLSSTTTSGTGPSNANSPRGSLSTTTNPNFTQGSPGINCSNNPGNLPPNLVTAVQTALTTGAYAPGGGVTSCTGIGGTHANAIGYVTVDVAANCSTKLPTDPTYYTTDILFDNVFIGDYQQLGPQPGGGTTGSYDAGGNPMVHIRAVPEGGGAGSLPGTNLPYTFYDRYTPTANRTADRRQPLPATWAARYIQGGTGAFATNFKIWREGYASGSCSGYAANGAIPISEIVRFDEHENPFTYQSGTVCSPCSSSTPTLPETSLTNTTAATYPALGSSDVGGWMYLNLNNGGSTAYSVTRNVGGTPTVITGSGQTTGLAPTGTGTTIRPSQNWVIIEMFGSAGSNRLSVDFDAAWLGNGCSAAAFTSTANSPSGVPIGPAGGVFVCPPGTTTTNGGSCTGTNVTPLP